MTKTPYRLIFEGPELVGKSFVISQVYDFLEKKYNSGIGLQDGCIWFNCDVGVFGSRDGYSLVESYLDIARRLSSYNLIFEKLYLTDMVNSKLLRGKDVSYFKIEKQLVELGFKLVCLKYEENESMLKKRIDDRLKLYPHYERIMHDPTWYFEQQKLLLALAEKSKLDTLVIDSTKLPGDVDRKILEWLGEI